MLFNTQLLDFLGGPPRHFGRRRQTLEPMEFHPSAVEANALSLSAPSARSVSRMLCLNLYPSQQLCSVLHALLAWTAGQSTRRHFHRLASHFAGDCSKSGNSLRIHAFVNTTSVSVSSAETPQLLLLLQIAPNARAWSAAGFCDAAEKLVDRYVQDSTSVADLENLSGLVARENTVRVGCCWWRKHVLTCYRSGLSTCG